MKTVCLVDDDELFKMIFKKGMEPSGLKNPVLEFSDGNEALEHFKISDATHKFPEVIFLDINMYNSDGWEFITKFHKVKKRFTEKN
jgi:CheY-like chemotaxis protein